MKETHIKGQKPKAANERGSKEWDALGDGFCP